MDFSSGHDVIPIKNPSSFVNMALLSMLTVPHMAPILSPALLHLLLLLSLQLAYLLSPPKRWKVESCLEAQGLQASCTPVEL